MGDRKSGLKRVLFVCLGNICRSPIAEAIFKHLISREERDLEDYWFADSCATSDYHIGCPPDPRAMACIKRHGIDYQHAVRQLCEDDFNTFEFIFGMDRNNLLDIEEIRPADGKAQVELLGNYKPGGPCIVHDPYYDSDEEGFEEVFQQCIASINAFLDKHHPRS